MGPARRILACSMALTLAVGLANLLGCSCEESEPPAPNVKIAQPKPAPGPAKRAPASASRQAGHAPGSSLIQAPADYMRTVTIKAPRYAKKTVGLALVRNDLGAYKAMQGEYPPSLEKLAEWRGSPLPELPRGQAFSYDPKTGKINVVAAQ